MYMDFFFWGVNMANTVKQTTKERNLTDILLGNINPEDQDIVFPNINKYLLIIVNLTYTGDDFKNEAELTLAAHTLLSDIIDRCIEKFSLRVHATTIKGNLCYVFALRANYEVRFMQTFLENAMSDVINFFRKFDFDIIVSSSNSHQGKDTLPDAYRESLDMLAHALKKSTYGLYYYMDVKEEHKTTYFYPQEKEQNIIKLLKSGEYDEIEKEFNEIYSRNFDNIFASLEMVRCLYIDILATVLKTCKSGIDGEMYLLTDTTAVMRLVLNCTEISVMTNSMLGLFKSCCDEIKMRNCGIEDSFVTDVQKYIQKNYSNINLNVTSVADEFLVHPNYLSKLFKKQMQMNMLSYVNNVRINEAKRLLSNTNYSLEEICDKTGFGSYRTFIRVFHQIVSISPSRYRNLTSNKN